jgi:hypothetical protein
MGDSLVVTVDPLLPFCKLYDGTVQHDNITPPPETITTTEAMVTTEPPIHTQSEGIPTTPHPTDMPVTCTRTTSNMVPGTIHSDSVTSITAAMDHTQSEEISTSGPNHTPGQTDIPATRVTSNVVTQTTLNSTSDSVNSVTAAKDHTLASPTGSHDEGTIKQSPTSLQSITSALLTKMKGFIINPSHTFRKLKSHTTPIYNPNSNEDEDDADAL